jgi:DNA polymerase-3 subunit epsilon
MPDKRIDLLVSGAEPTQNPPRKSSEPSDELATHWTELNPKPTTQSAKIARIMNDHKKDRDDAILWARRVLSSPDDYYILDTETTGLNEPEIIELAIMDLEERAIVNQRFNPKTQINPGAIAVHGLTPEKMARYPRLGVIAYWLEKILYERRLLIYNFEFDHKALLTSWKHFDRELTHIKGFCVMEWYSQFIGEWNQYRGSYRWQKLPGGDHSAMGDCIATLQVIQEMAAAKLSTELFTDVDDRWSDDVQLEPLELHVA